MDARFFHPSLRAYLRKTWPAWLAIALIATGLLTSAIDLARAEASLPWATWIGLSLGAGGVCLLAGHTARAARSGVWPAAASAAAPIELAEQPVADFATEHYQVRRPQSVAGLAVAVGQLAFVVLVRNPVPTLLALGLAIFVFPPLLLVTPLVGLQNSCLAVLAVALAAGAWGAWRQMRRTFGAGRPLLVLFRAGLAVLVLISLLSGARIIMSSVPADLARADLSSGAQPQATTVAPPSHMETITQTQAVANPAASVEAADTEISLGLLVLIVAAIVASRVGIAEPLKKLRDQFGRLGNSPARFVAPVLIGLFALIFMQQQNIVLVSDGSLQTPAVDQPGAATNPSSGTAAVPAPSGSSDKIDLDQWSNTPPVVSATGGQGKPPSPAAPGSPR
jgi:hypothetical protein